MNEALRQKAIEEALEKRANRRPIVLDNKSDWYATCQRCKVQVTGTIDEIKAHRCGE